MTTATIERTSSNRATKPKPKDRCKATEKAKGNYGELIRKDCPLMTRARKRRKKSKPMSRIGGWRSAFKGTPDF